MLLKSFRSKLRSQINKALKEEFTTRVGGLELLEDFYKVFLVNMRDLGSPVHSVKLMRRSLIAFPEHARIIVVYRSTEPVAAALVIGFGNVLRNPWAASLRKYASLGPNMLLYLRMLEYACAHGYKVFDSVDPLPGREPTVQGAMGSGGRAALLALPLSRRANAGRGRRGQGEVRDCHALLAEAAVILARIIGPRIRKHISL